MLMNVLKINFAYFKLTIHKINAYIWMIKFYRKTKNVNVKLMSAQSNMIFININVLNYNLKINIEQVKK